MDKSLHRSLFELARKPLRLLTDLPRPFFRANPSIFLPLFLAICWSCNPKNGEEVVPEPEKHFLVEDNLKLELSKELLVNLATFAGYGEFTGLVTTGIEIYTITYKTQFQGDEVIASGVVCIPLERNGELPLLSAHRGTILSNNEAPSETTVMYGLELFSSIGYITILSDMIGFGSSYNEVFHPYYNKEATVATTLDMISAAKEFLTGKNIAFSDQLFLVGYSQGGYTTAAVHEAIESDPSLGLGVTASAAGAGSYNIVNVMAEILGMETYGSPGFLANIIYTFDKAYGWDKPMSYYFQEPYAEKIPMLLDGTLRVGEVNAELTEVLSELFQTDFLERLENGTETEVLAAFEENSTGNFAPMAPMRLYHSEFDELVPYVDSENTYQTMLSLGGNVTFTAAGDGDHSDNVTDMLQLVFPWFESLRE